MQTDRQSINNSQRRHEMGLELLKHLGYLDTPNFDNALRVISSHAADSVVDLAVHVNGPGFRIEFSGRDKLEAFLLHMNVWTAPGILASSAVSTTFVSNYQMPSHSTMHVLASKGFDGLVDRTEDDYANGSHNRKVPQLVYMPVDEHKFQAVVFAPSLSSLADDHEALLGENLRSVSPEAKVQDGGLYSGIVMIKASFGDSGAEYTLSTGIVIDEKHVATVAHGIWDKRYGPSKSITIYRDGRVDPYGTDHYHVEAASIHSCWAKSHSKANDFALLRIVDRFSDKIKPMKYRQTAVDGVPIATTIYGFASDLPGLGNTLLPQLAQSQGSAAYNSDERLVHHNGDTVKGASGGPIVDEGGVVIAIHRGWGRSSLVNHIINQAVTIDRYNNNVQSFVLALEAYLSHVDDSQLVRGLPVMFQATQVIPFAWDRELGP
ncbi:trypsin-like cysteine/serine peptidase domain-containing protein [Nemania abortiva]|nr:trypsin-like cysteine/serine peptidase domain-containing protein [Nemania abortiva]